MKPRGDGETEILPSSSPPTLYRSSSKPKLLRLSRLKKMFTLNGGMSLLKASTIYERDRLSIFMCLFIGHQKNIHDIKDKYN